ncbi:MAG: hypothetical protein JRN62_10100 [Nitrososphaerota archaeon]|nr:hypothetical protein [Nitrososphaerota archaeon]MDG6949816.1 hypothetical protein [Nitrososphaerota archaeon]
MKLPGSNDLMFKALKSMAGPLGVPDEFFDLIPKLKVKDASFDTDEESLTVYAQVTVQDKEALDALVKFATLALDKIKGLNEE